MSDIEATVAMAWDAFRLCLFLTPRRFTPEEIVRWVTERARPEAGREA